ncbi:hypothetical protein [Bdellovibrio bacteriovorus]|uniref:Uncharacterized protein n=1 Tax=Bdellovibrio bacteriovorus TaxID=959 RepID=A0A150WGH9_BDEBC|nr:hypothetical protein [Bdellovibrio bacteriovorus]KYG62074.1 hypothetical protein AZI85_07690 [Bdellovibrio bacteriovorus]KYG68261.1 hypothetical protein AZI87_03110 [Bdellovibrio bacteriovorus]
MKNSKFIEAEQIAFEEISDSYAALKLGEEKFVIDMDTLYDLAFRSAAFLAYLENREEELAEADGDEAVCACKRVH